VCHLLLPLMNSFNKTEASIIHMQAMLSKDFPFCQIIFASDLYSLSSVTALPADSVT